jgi:diguanylate cyclase (GGDEF)-like protein/PAS domain S-box-containing protein
VADVIVVNTIRVEDVGVGVGVDLEVYRAFGERFSYALVLVDADLEIIWSSPASTDVLGYAPEEMVGMSVLDMVHPDDVDQVMPMALEIVGRAAETMDRPAAAKAVDLPVRVRNASGQWVPVSVSGRVFDDSGRLLAVIRPAAERHALGVVLDEMGTSAGFDSVLESLVALLCAQFDVDQAWLVHDHDGVGAVVGPGSDAGVGEPAELLSSIREGGLSPEVRFDDHRWIVPVLSGTQETLCAVLVLPSPRQGGPSPFDAHVLRRTVTLASLAFTRAKDDRLLRRAATTDYLTGVLNRRAFEAQLAPLALDPGAFPVTLFFVDVDEFKSVNDLYGHRMGDAVLIAVAKRLARTVREHDFVGRLGGDEFAVACPGLPDQDVQPTRQRIRAAFDNPVGLSGRQVSVSVSVGVATAYDEDALEQLVDLSDADMYRQKKVARDEPPAT